MFIRIYLLDRHGLLLPITIQLLRCRIHRGPDFTSSLFCLVKVFIETKNRCLFNIGLLTDDSYLRPVWKAQLCPYLVFTDLLSLDLLYLNRVQNYTLMFQLVKGFDGSISTNFQISFFCYFFVISSGACFITSSCRSIPSYNNIARDPIKVVVKGSILIMPLRGI